MGSIDWKWFLIGGAFFLFLLPRLLSLFSGRKAAAA